MFQQSITKQQNQSVPYGQNLNSRPSVPAPTKSFFPNSNILQRVHPSSINASSTIARPNAAFSSSLRITQPQQYVQMNPTSTYLGNTNQIVQNRIQSQSNNTLMLLQPVENTGFSNGFLNNNASLNNTFHFQENVRAQPKTRNENFLANKNLKETSLNKGIRLNESTQYVAPNPVKQNDKSKIRLLTGTAEKIIKWHKVYKDYFCHYELIAQIVSIQEGTVRLQRVLILRDKRGPIIQVVYYMNDYINTQNFYVGQSLRCVGRMVGPNIMHGLSIREARPEEITTLNRMCYISEHAIAKAINKN